MWCFVALTSVRCFSKQEASLWRELYSLRHLGLFTRPLLTVSDEGAFYKETRYGCGDVKRVIVVGSGGSPKRMGVYLSDGKKIVINAVALELNGKKPKSGFLSGTNTAFEELREYFEANHL